jgi:hypothetical protein
MQSKHQHYIKRPPGNFSPRNLEALAGSDMVKQLFWVKANEGRHLFGLSRNLVSNLIDAIVHVVLRVPKHDLEDFFADDEVSRRCSPYCRTTKLSWSSEAVVQLRQCICQLCWAAAYVVIAKVGWWLDDTVPIADTWRATKVGWHILVVHVDGLEETYAKFAQEERRSCIHILLLV